MTTKNCLNRKQVYDLTKWIEDHLDDIKRERWTQKVAAEKASQALGFRVTDGNVRGIASQDPTAVIQFEWPRSEARRSGKISPDDLSTVVEMLDQVLSWNHDAFDTLPSELKDRWTSLAERAKGVS